MDKLTVLGFLIVAPAMQSSGDAIVRIGLAQQAIGPLTLIFLAGAILLFGYGLTLNLAPIPFGRVIGIYVAALFVMWRASITLPSDPCRRYRS